MFTYPTIMAAGHMVVGYERYDVIYFQSKGIHYKYNSARDAHNQETLLLVILSLLILLDLWTRKINRLREGIHTQESVTLNNIDSTLGGGGLTT